MSNQIEEFTKIYRGQFEEEDNQDTPEKPKEESNEEEGEDDKINVKESENNKKYEQRKDTSNRLNSYSKRYKTYTMEYKKQLIQEVNLKIIIICKFQVKLKNDEKEVAKIYGINPKTLHRWITKGLKKNQGKYFTLYNKSQAVGGK